MLVDVYANRKQEEVLRDTWGHLAPKPRHVYHGFALTAVSPNGDYNLLDFSFDGLEGNPWTYDHVHYWWSGEIGSPRFDRSVEVIAFWRWIGTYMVQKNDRPVFRGSYERMTLVPSPIRLRVTP